MISDVVSRKWIADVTSADETSIEVQAVFNRALRVEGLDAVIEQRNPQGTPWDPDCDEAPVLLVMSDNGPQMSSGTTREFMALCWLATHYGRPGTPTDQAWIESLFGHLKIEQPHLELPTVAAAGGLLADVETLHLDRGYDYGAVKATAANHGIDDVVCAKRRKRGAAAAKTTVPLGLRWAIERTNSWLSNFGQLRRNTDRRPRHRLAQLALAIALLLTAKLIDWRNRWSPQ